MEQEPVSYVKEPTSGDRVGPWEIGVLLGQGQYGKVYSAQHFASKEKVALKVIDDSTCIASGTTSEEVKVIEYVTDHIEHDTLLKLVGSAQERVIHQGKYTIMAVELLQGHDGKRKNLCGHLREGLLLKGFREQDARKLFHKLVSGIGKLHQHFIVHQDVKLENFVYKNVNDLDTIRILDYGFARILEGGKRINVLNQFGREVWVGTEAYMSPEMFCHRMSNLAGDCWSLGIILYQILSGELPPANLFHLIRDKLWDFETQGRWNRISRPAKDLVRRLLTLEPPLRITCAQALTHTWFTAELVEVEGGDDENAANVNEISDYVGRRYRNYLACRGLTD